MNPHVPIGSAPGTKRECASGSDDEDEPGEPDYPSYDVMVDYDVGNILQVNDSVIVPINQVTRGHFNATLFDDPSVCKDNNINRNDFTSRHRFGPVRAFRTPKILKLYKRLYSRYSHMMMWSFMFPEIVCLFYSLYFICFKKARRPEWSILGHHCLLEFLFA